MKQNYLLSIVIPAYNEERKIKRDILGAFTYLKRKKFRGEVIICSDSTDKTNKIVKKLQKKFTNLKLIIGRQRMGKGRAVKNGVALSRGKYIAFVDAGSCVSYDYLDVGIGLIKQGFDCAIAIRTDSKSVIKKYPPIYRLVGSFAFRMLIETVLSIPYGIKDTQCGFKIYKKMVAKNLYSQLKINGFMFDVEIILRSGKLYYSIGQFPVEWTNDPDSKFQILSGGIQDAWELLKIKGQYRL